MLYAVCRHSSKISVDTTRSINILLANNIPHTVELLITKTFLSILYFKKPIINHVSIIVQQDATIYSFILFFLHRALHFSDDTLIHHQEHTPAVITSG